MTDSTTQAVLDMLAEEVGVKNTVGLLVFALPLIAERREALQHHLRVSDWQAASRIAHQTLGSVRMYGSSHMEYLLQQVRQQERDVIGSIAFQQELDQAFEAAICELQQWLDDHPV
jgi:HPt (histidine-containing phosphotransfer) domain-containing protein